MSEIHTVSERWKDRKTSNLVLWLKKHGELRLPDIAKYLGYSEATINNKLFRDNFSFNDLMIIAAAAHYSFALIPNDAEAASVRIDFVEWFKDYNDAALERFKEAEAIRYEEKAQLYETKKAELLKLKAELDDFVK